MPFFETMPTIMIMPIIETTLSVVCVMSSAARLPESASTAPATMAVGCANERNSIDEHEEHQRDGQAEGDEQLAEASLLLLIQAAVLDRHAGREMHVAFASCAWMSVIAEPRSRPSSRAVTATDCRSPSRSISVWPGS